MPNPMAQKAALRPSGATRTVARKVLDLDRFKLLPDEDVRIRLTGIMDGKAPAHGRTYEEQLEERRLRKADDQYTGYLTAKDRISVCGGHISMYSSLDGERTLVRLPLLT